LQRAPYGGKREKDGHKKKNKKRGSGGRKEGYTPLKKKTPSRKIKKEVKKERESPRTTALQKNIDLNGDSGMVQVHNPAQRQKVRQSLERRPRSKVNSGSGLKKLKKHNEYEGEKLMQPGGGEGGGAFEKYGVAEGGRGGGKNPPALGPKRS